MQDCSTELHCRLTAFGSTKIMKQLDEVLLLNIVSNILVKSLVTDVTSGRKEVLMMIVGVGVGNILLVSVCSSWLQWETGQTAAARDPCKYGSQWSQAAALVTAGNITPS